MVNKSLSIVIPTLNEAANIEATLLSLQQLREQGVELLLSDGGSSDQTCLLAEPWVDQQCNADQGRANQMNAGARVASGDYLLFLHADTHLPESFAEHWQQIITEQPDWGYCAIRLSGRHWLLRVVERMMNWRSRVTRVATGDQAMFVHRELFERIGGFATIPLMEDIEICKRLRKIATPVRITTPVVTSSRRWEERGIVTTILLMWRLRLAYFLGVSPEQLVARYYPSVVSSLSKKASATHLSPETERTS